MEPLQLKALSWNIWCDGHFNDIKTLLQQKNADIVCLQEVLPESTDIPIIAYMQSLGYQYTSGHSTMLNWKQETPQPLHNAVFSKYPIVHSAVHQLSQEHSRSAVQATIAAGFTMLDVFSVHLWHTHQKPNPIQEEQARNLLTAVPTQNALVMGDFNATPDSATIKIITEKLKNTDPTNAPTWSMYDAGCTECAINGVKKRLDYIFTTPDVLTHSPTVLQSTGSDHLPVVVTVIA